jgi:hypothetical protein
MFYEFIPCVFNSYWRNSGESVQVYSKDFEDKIREKFIYKCFLYNRRGM